MKYSSQDKINIFISSRLDECNVERQIACDAIISLNHNPIMFEEAGARPYPPRSVYLSGIDDSVLFIGIYREGYGFVGDGMSISGLEDEYIYSKTLGKPQLLYVKNNIKRDPRLESLVATFAGSGVTFKYYDDTNELFDRIRDDVTSWIAQYYYGTQYRYDDVYTDPDTILKTLISPKGLVSRDSLKSTLINCLVNNHSVLLVGPYGIGKTIFLAATACEESWIFVQCGDRVYKDILYECVCALRKHLGLSQNSFVNIEETLKQLRACWLAAQNICLVLDDVRNVDINNDILANVDLNKSHSIVFSSRVSFAHPSIFILECPPFSDNEIRDYVINNRKEPLLPGELIDLSAYSKDRKSVV